jgi:hypothetical protein
MGFRVGIRLLRSRSLGRTGYKQTAMDDDAALFDETPPQEARPLGRDHGRLNAQKRSFEILAEYQRRQSAKAALDSHDGGNGPASSNIKKTAP